jgi:hypothetical protein
MLLVRDVFRCKPGQAGELARRLKQMAESMSRDDGFDNCRVMVDLVTTYWTVVMQAEVPDLATFERHMAEYPKREDLRAAMSGYMDLVEGGHREIFRMV